nr:immunoglobulin light chain junction region [Macaca mulatta]MOW39939.1 immunoglobulin light chain junction region [Macaca mulatta]
CQECNTFPPTF